ncbi:MAG: peptide deformylase [Clostridiales bacterium]|mgnify:FL=1|jgi:peptide deformylase|nr:peptide deformylase [Clostridiales bacterium]
MAIRNIFKDGEPVLRRRAREVNDFDTRLSELLDDMKETLELADGVGLAAPQVGISKRVIIVDTPDDGYFEFINPEIVYAKGKQVMPEGCLSVNKEENCYVQRPMTVKVSGFDRKGTPITVTAKGLTARAFCHEIDHLNGILFYDKKVDPPKSESKNNDLDN